MHGNSLLATEYSEQRPVIRLHQESPSVQELVKLLHCEHQSESFLLELSVVPFCLVQASRHMGNRPHGSIFEPMHQNSTDSILACVCSNYYVLPRIIVH